MANFNRFLQLVLLIVVYLAQSKASSISPEKQSLIAPPKVSLFATITVTFGNLLQVGTTPIGNRVISSTQSGTIIGHKIDLQGTAMTLRSQRGHDELKNT